MVAVNADVVGFSSLMAEDPQATASAIESHRRLVEQRVAESGGILVNFVGDSFMALFPDPAQALRASIAISSDVEADNADRARHQWVRFRIGIDQGDVTRAGSEYLGDALNVAARIQERARPGGISVSGSVFRALDEPELRFRSTGRHRLKNIPESVEVFDFADLPSDNSLTDRRRTTHLTLATPTIVVLPIHNDKANPSVQAASDVIRSDLVHRLSAIPRLQVIDAGVGGHENLAPAQYMLETGVLQIGDVVRVYAKILYTATMNVVTSHKWSTTLDEMLSISDEIAEEVARVIGIELILGEQARLYADVASPESVGKLYQGWYHLTAENPQDWRRAVDLFDDVARSQPEEPFGPTLAAFAKWLGASEGYADDPEALFDEAFNQASAVAEKGDPTGLAHMIQGAVYMSRGQTDRALEVIGEAHITRPTCDVTYAVEGSVRRYLGEWEKAVNLMETAMRLSVVTPPWYATVQACSLFMGGRLDMAAATAEEVIEYSPNSLEALLVLVASQTEMGLERRARATAETIRERFPAVDVDQWLTRHPFTDPGMVDRWRADLKSVGLVTAD